MRDPQEQFKQAMRARGIVPPDVLLADGRLHRCDVNTPNGKDDGSYLLYLDGIPAGGFVNWQDGQGWEKWRYQGARPFSHQEEQEYRSRVENNKAQYYEERRRREEEARERADEIWNKALPDCAHPYLEIKGVQAYGTRTVGDRLLIPMHDTDGVIHSLQFIDIAGKKRFLRRGRVHGCHFLIGRPEGKLYIAEGYATAASIHAATGHAVAVAFNALNMLAVAQAMRNAYPDLEIILCADDDYRNPGNPGRTSAFRAAQLVKGLVAYPDFGVARPEDATDFNDLERLNGPDAVRRCVERARPALSIGLSDIVCNTTASTTPCHSQQHCSDAAEKGAVQASCRVDNGRFELSDAGVFYIGLDSHGDDKKPLWVCAPLRVVAKTRDAQSGEWGRLLEWRDDDGITHQWAMPLEMLQGDGADVRKELARLGLSISVHRAARELLAAYINAWPTQERARCVHRLGWYDDVYVAPNTIIGAKNEIVVFQNPHALKPAMSVSGTVEQWREAVAGLAKGNPRLLFAISVAFAGTLVGLIGEDSGGFHFCGTSSSGKTTALKAAASVWGHPDCYTRLWRVTANGLEGLAALHNDGVLILDELSQIDPRDAGEAAYLLANGQGKARASRTGMARPSARWKLLVLSSGEETLANIMAKAGKRANAGQEIRLVDIDADAGKGMGIFETLHDHGSPAKLAVAIKEAADQTHGAVGLAWLEALVAHQKDIRETATDAINAFVEAAVPQGSSGQVIRVAKRFALVQYAGELATQFDLTGWEKGEAAEAALQCFDDWLASFGGTSNREERSILGQVRAFFEIHGASRFQSMDCDMEQKVVSRAGFLRVSRAGMQEYLVFPEVFQNEICQGRNPKAVIKVLLAHGWLEPGGDGRPTQKPRIRGMGTIRLYVFTPNMWQDAEDERKLAA